MSTIVYEAGMDLWLIVRDTGLLEGYTLYFDGDLTDEVGDQEKRSYPIARPTGSVAIVIHFNGDDGGASGIFDLAHGGARLDRQTGDRHSYLISGAAPTDRALVARPRALRAIVTALHSPKPAPSPAPPEKSAKPKRRAARS